MKIELSKQLPQSKGKKLLKKATPTNANCLVVLLDKDNQLLGTSDVAGIDAYQSRIDNLIEVANFKGKLGETVADYALASDSKKSPLQLLLVGVGDSNKLTTTNLQKVATAIYKAMAKRVETLTLVTGDIFDNNEFTQFVLGLLNASYRFDKYKSEQPPAVLQNIVLVSQQDYQDAVDYATAVFSGQSLTRDVANEPGNICFPAYMAEQAQALAKSYPDLLKVTVLDEKKMSKLGMNCFLSVAQGSERDGQLIILEYQGKSKFSTNMTASFAASIKDAVADKLPRSKKSKKAQVEEANTEANTDDAPIVLVGKGVTFDTGGISLKPAAGMDEMKFDMGGAASVLGTIKALCEARLAINVVGALACAENMPSGRATRPGDIVKAMNGKSVEIMNTDAEGRLVLSDTLCYVQRYQPKAIIDVATLTGACVIALGHVRSAVYSNNEDVLFELENASEQSGDLVWHMPLDDAYQSQLDSPIADMQNIGGRPAGSVTAACFLSRFIEEGQAWAHIDIAGTAWNSGKEKGATGRPVPLFMQYLKNLATHTQDSQTQEQA
ncbi:leucyl aminopeptidase [Psychrobacter sp. I-STPA6b]|uniref:leucyl aminopeptidase n=1 Tax=Psychrobacter sp. I-STPA6b TaxID=2585718 RepID=UPI001D0BFD2A|nr:leucyl aminopeptidase [Psychrobacter sp. I-STPA6b]